MPSSEGIPEFGYERLLGSLEVLIEGSETCKEFGGPLVGGLQDDLVSFAMYEYLALIVREATVLGKTDGLASPVTEEFGLFGAHENSIDVYIRWCQVGV